MVKNPAANAADTGLIPGSGRSPGGGNDNPLQCTCRENLMDRRAMQATVHGVAKSQTRLCNFTFTFHFLALEKEMATHSSVLAWRIPGTGEPGGLLSMGSHRGTRLKRLSSSSSCTLKKERKTVRFRLRTSTCDCIFLIHIGQVGT